MWKEAMCSWWVKQRVDSFSVSTISGLCKPLFHKEWCNFSFLPNTYRLYKCILVFINRLWGKLTPGGKEITACVVVQLADSSCEVYLDGKESKFSCWIVRQNTVLLQYLDTMH